MKAFSRFHSSSLFMHMKKLFISSFNTQQSEVYPLETFRMLSYSCLIPHEVPFPFRQLVVSSMNILSNRGVRRMPI